MGKASPGSSSAELIPRLPLLEILVSPPLRASHKHTKVVLRPYLWSAHTKFLAASHGTHTPNDRHLGTDLERTNVCPTALNRIIKFRKPKPLVRVFEHRKPVRVSVFGGCVGRRITLLVRSRVESYEIPIVDQLNDGIWQCA